MTDHEDKPKTVPSVSDTDQAVTEEQRARASESPEVGYPAGTTDPHEGLSGDEGQVNADATPTIADDAEAGQTQVPAASDDVNDAPDRKLPGQ